MDNHQNVNLKNCECHQIPVSFSGYALKVSEGMKRNCRQLHPDLKTKPKNSAVIQQFLGFVNALPHSIEGSFLDSGVLVHILLCHHWWQSSSTTSGTWTNM